MPKSVFQQLVEEICAEAKGDLVKDDRVKERPVFPSEETTSEELCQEPAA